MVWRSRVPPHWAHVDGFILLFLPSGPGIEPAGGIISMDGNDVNTVAVKCARNVERFAIHVGHEQNLGIGQIVATIRKLGSPDRPGPCYPVDPPTEMPVFTCRKLTETLLSADP